MPRSEARSPPKQAMASSGNLLRKQRAAINALAADNRRMKEELMEENRYSADPTTQAGKKLIQNLESQDETYATLIKEQQQIMEAMLAREADLRGAIEIQRAAMGGINNAAEVSIRAQRRVILLENRVQQAAAARSAAELQANKLKEKVDGLRREKRLFEELTGKMEAAVASRAEDIAEILAKTTATHDAKGKAEQMRAQVLAQAAKDATAAEAEWNQLSSVIQADWARREELQAQKTAERARKMEELLQRQRAVAAGRHARKPRSPAVPATLAATETAKESTKLASEAAIGDNDAESQAPPMERLSLIQEKLNTVVAAMEGCDNPEGAVTAITELKDTCFRLFASLTEAHMRLEGLEDGVAQARATAAAASAAVAPVAVAQISNEGPPTADQEDFDQQLARAEKQIQDVCTAVHKLSQRIRSNCPEIDAALEKEGAPTAGTLLEFIGLLEHYTRATLRHHRNPQNKDSGHNRRGSAVETFWNQVLVKGPDDGGATALVDPPSVPESSSHRGSFSSGRSGGSSTSSDAGRKKLKDFKGRVKARQSVATSETSSEGPKVLDLGVLSQRAQKAVAMRLADAATVTITSQQGTKKV